MVVFVAALLILMVWLVATVLRRSQAVPSGSPGVPTQHPGPRLSAEEILAERLAHGNIEVEDYHRRLEALRQSRPKPS